MDLATSLFHFEGQSHYNNCLGETDMHIHNYTTSSFGISDVYCQLIKFRACRATNLSGWINPYWKDASLSSSCVDAKVQQNHVYANLRIIRNEFCATLMRVHVEVSFDHFDFLFEKALRTF